MTIAELLQALVNIETLIKSSAFPSEQYKHLKDLRAEMMGALLDETLITTARGNTYEILTTKKGIPMKYAALDLEAMIRHQEQRVQAYFDGCRNTGLVVGRIGNNRPTEAFMDTEQLAKYESLQNTLVLLNNCLSRMCDEFTGDFEDFRFGGTE